MATEYKLSYTASEINEKLGKIDGIEQNILNLNASKQMPLFVFVNTIEECTDTSKLYVLPDGYIYAYIKTQQWKDGYTNWIPVSTVSGGGSIYNKNGYILNKRLNSSGIEKDCGGSIATGFIPITKNSVLRIKNFANGDYDLFDDNGNHICLYNSSYTLLTTSQQGYGYTLQQNSIGNIDDTTGIYTVNVSDIYNDDAIAFVRVSTMVTPSESVVATDEDIAKVAIAIDEEIVDGYYIDFYQWANTEYTLFSVDYEDKISDLEEEVADHKLRITSLENGASGGATVNSNSIPDYWLEELETKADEIQVAMEKAGRNKSAFLWYTDAHWVNGNSKVSPSLLDYLYMNTPMNKVNFGGDIIGDVLFATRDDMKYLYEWRKAIKDLPNHHSVLGNHDMFDSDSVDYEDDNYRYAFMIAPEETSDMVMGNGNYYYIDNPSEKTRYLYLCYPNTANTAEVIKQGEFIVDAIKTVKEGWHIVAIAHRWFQYNSASTPTIGVIAAFESDILSVFDAYNARANRSGSNYFYAQDFTDAKGKVEFCIGGHIHVDYDFTSEGGIPVIITTADANQNRVPSSTVDSGTIGTTTEAAVFGIIADYNDPENIKITVVGVGRGTSRVVRKSTVKPESISEINYNGDTTVGTALDKSKFSFTVNYSNGTTETVTGATSVSPATIAVVGNNTVTITYTEGTVTLSGTLNIVGTAVPVANLFDKNDPDVAIGHRVRSTGETQYHAEGQLVTGFIEAKVGDTFTISSDKSQMTNNYTGHLNAYNEQKGQINALINQAYGEGGWAWSSDNLSGTVTIPDMYSGTGGSFVGTAFVRFCVAYTDIDSIVITKS